MIKDMELSQATVEIQTSRATYTLPAEQINIGAVSALLGTALDLADLDVSIEISEPTSDMVEVVESSMEEGNLSIVIPPVSFTVHADYQGKRVDIAQFTAYVTRLIAIPAGVDPGRITTGTVVDSDGTVRHVPTKVVVIDGIYYAQINSMTNSVYTVVWNPAQFIDLGTHWARDEVNDMGARLVVFGEEDGTFNPNRSVSRGEFFASAARGLGLNAVDTAGLFSELNAGDPNIGAIAAAFDYRLFSGFEDGSYRLADRLTREQAAAVLIQMLRIAGAKLPVSAADALADFSDGSSVAGWAQDNVKLAVAAGLLKGRSEGKLSPKDYVTRAEAAVMIRRALEYADLI